MSKILRIFNTIKFLKPKQIVFRLKRKLCRKTRKDLKYEGSINKYSLLWKEILEDEEFLKRYDLELIKKNKVNILNTELSLDYSFNYLNNLKPLLKFNILYFEYLVYLAFMYKKTNNQSFKDLFENIYEEYLNSTKESQPYIYSVQLINIFICLECFGKFSSHLFYQRTLDELYSQYKFLLKNQEKDLLANHYLENLKAIIVSSFIFKEYRVFNKYLKKFKKELKNQILDDGFHFELSGMYHKIILEDLLIIYKLLDEETKKKNDWLKKYIIKMTRAMMSFEEGFNRTPLFNDVGDNVSKQTKTLFTIVKNNICNNIENIKHLKESGYYKLYSDNISVVFDVGKIGPSYNAGHGHCDCLSYELAYKDTPIFVNSGTYHYQDGFRNYFRSTKAHNTFHIDNDEQSEIYDEHKVARRIKNINVEIKNENCIVGSCYSYKNVKYKRMIDLNKNTFTIIDDCNVKGALVYSYLRISPKFKYVLNSNNIEIYDLQGIKICDIIPMNTDINLYNEGIMCLYSESFGKIDKTECLEFRWIVDDSEHGYKIIFK